MSSIGIKMGENERILNGRGAGPHISICPIPGLKSKGFTFLAYSSVQLFTF
jgi:hypothetical protein